MRVLLTVVCAAYAVGMGWMTWKTNCEMKAREREVQAYIDSIWDE
jgi:hypothetical protein